MKALILTSGGPMAARIVNAWLAGGNTVGALWVGQKLQRRAFHEDRVLGLAAPSWSVTALARRCTQSCRRGKTQTPPSSA